MSCFKSLVIDDSCMLILRVLFDWLRWPKHKLQIQMGIIQGADDVLASQFEAPSSQVNHSQPYVKVGSSAAEPQASDQIRGAPPPATKAPTVDLVSVGTLSISSSGSPVAPASAEQAADTVAGELKVGD